MSVVGGGLIAGKVRYIGDGFTLLDFPLCAIHQGRGGMGEPQQEERGNGEYLGRNKSPNGLEHGGVESYLSAMKFQAPSPPPNSVRTEVY